MRDSVAFQYRRLFSQCIRNLYSSNKTTSTMMPDFNISIIITNQINLNITLFKTFRVMSIVVQAENVFINRVIDGKTLRKKMYYDKSQQICCLTCIIRTNGIVSQHSVMHAISDTSFIITSHHQNITHLITFYFTLTDPLTNEKRGATMINIFVLQKRC